MVNLKPQNEDEKRVANYRTFEKIFKGEHFEAFKIKVPQVAKDYEALRYVATNFGGMVSKLAADMLFEEFPKISVKNTKGNEFLEALFFANKFRTQAYECALETSYRGDGLWRIRSADGKCFVEDINPEVYYPEYNDGNVREEVKAHVLQWKMKLAGRLTKEGKPVWAIFKEIHRKGEIENQLYEINDQGEFVAGLDVKAYLGVDTIVATGVNDFLVVHIPNYRVNSSIFGISDYYDLQSLFFAINNRITKTDNILDKHGDPILAVPPGVLDESGKVRKESFGVIEVDTSEAGGGKPEYIVWDAKLESAFKHIDMLVQHLFLTSETSFAAFGMDKGSGNAQVESGKALKFKLLRTLAKKHRKQLYFDDGLKQLLFTAMEFAKANSLECAGVKMMGKVEVPQIEWKDGIVNDDSEQLDQEVIKLDNGLTTTKDAISRLEGISDKDAEAKVEEIKKEQEAKAPKFSAAPVIVPPADGKNNGK